VNTGSYVTFDETQPEMAKMIVSSSSIPFAFTPQVWNYPDGSQVVCMDGGTVYNTNLVSAVKRCRETVDDDSEITLDIFVLDTLEITPW
jgi:predicted acylesterase/phospholipase RssA